MSENTFDKMIALFNVISEGGDNGVTAKDITGIIGCDRRTLGKKVNSLNRFFYCCANGTENGYCANGPDNVINVTHKKANKAVYSLNKESPYCPGNGALPSLTFAELRFLVDATLAANFMTENMVIELCGKLVNLTERSQRAFLKSYTEKDDGRYHKNCEVMKSVEIICRAIADNKKVSFGYFYLNEKCERDYFSAPRTIAPYGLIFNNGYYYLVGYSFSDNGKKTYRIDRMTGVVVLEEDILQSAPRNGKREFETRDIKRLLTGNSMWTDENKTVTLSVKRRLLGDIYDKFGENVRPTPDSSCNDFYIVKVYTTVSKVFLNWCALFGGEIKIVEPPAAVEKMKAFLQKNIAVYTDPPLT